MVETRNLIRKVQTFTQFQKIYVMIKGTPNIMGFVLMSFQFCFEFLFDKKWLFMKNEESSSEIFNKFRLRSKFYVNIITGSRVSKTFVYKEFNQISGN